MGKTAQNNETLYFKRCKLTTEELTIRSNRHWQPTQPSRIPVFRGQYIHHSLLFWSLYSSYPLTLFRKKPLWWDSKNNLSRVFPILLHTIEIRASFSPVSSAWLVVSLFLYLFFFKRREQYVYTRNSCRHDLLCTPLLLPRGWKALKCGWKEGELNARVGRSRTEGFLKTFLPFSFFTVASSGIGESTLLEAKLTEIPFGPRGPLDPDFPRWPLWPRLPRHSLEH